MPRFADLSEHVRLRIRAELKGAMAQGAQQAFADANDPRKITVIFPNGRIVRLEVEDRLLAPGYRPGDPPVRTVVKG